MGNARAVWDDNGLFGDAAAARVGSKQPSMCSTPPLDQTDHVDAIHRVAGEGERAQRQRRPRLPIEEIPFCAKRRSPSSRRSPPAIGPVASKRKTNNNGLMQQQAAPRLRPLPL